MTNKWTSNYQITVNKSNKLQKLPLKPNQNSSSCSYGPNSSCSNGPNSSCSNGPNSSIEVCYDIKPDLITLIVRVNSISLRSPDKSLRSLLHAFIFSSQKTQKNYSDKNAWRSEPFASTNSIIDDRSPSTTNDQNRFSLSKKKPRKKLNSTL